MSNRKFYKLSDHISEDQKEKKGQIDVQSYEVIQL